MSVRSPQHPDPARVATLKAALQRDLDRMLEWRGPVTEVRRLVAELDHLDAQFQRAAGRAGTPTPDQLAN